MSPLGEDGWALDKQGMMEEGRRGLRLPASQGHAEATGLPTSLPLTHWSASLFSKTYFGPKFKTPASTPTGHVNQKSITQPISAAQEEVGIYKQWQLPFPE